jgi:hypothetical protein
MQYTLHIAIPTIMATLQQSIIALRVTGIHGDFIPQKSLFDLVTRTEIFEELRRNDYPPEDLSESSDILARAGRKVFAILVEIGAVKHTAEFLSGNLLDGKLPFLKGDLDHFKDPSLVVKFLKFQWDYLAPLWGDGSSSHKILAANAILPFTKEEFLSKGNFGKAFVVTFEATHQCFTECTGGDVCHCAILNECAFDWRS